MSSFAAVSVEAARLGQEKWAEADFVKAKSELIRIAEKQAGPNPSHRGDRDYGAKMGNPKWWIVPRVVR